MSKNKPPELGFQQHVADYLVREHGYGVLKQSDITDTEHFIAEDLLWAFLKATQADTLKKLDDYGSDARDEIFKALRKELGYKPLRMILRDGLPVRGLEFRLFYSKPRSSASAGTDKYPENRITFRPHFYFGDTNKEIDFVFFLNGLPIVAMELKHEANQNVHDAVKQFADRDHKHKIFSHPFLYLAADTSDVMAATDPRREENFRWHNMGLVNTPMNPNEYPIEFLYREVLSKEHLLEALSFFLVRVPKRDAMDDKPERAAFTIFPRYHQSRLVRKVADNVLAHFSTHGNIGLKFLAEHSPGSGKTLSICWLAERLHSLYKPDTNEKLVDVTFILTDRTALDDNIRRDFDNFTHLDNVRGYADRSDDLPLFLKQRKPIIVSTQQKFAWILDQIEKNPELKKLRVAFLIDEAHRSQEGRMGAAIRLPFRKTDEPDADAPEQDPEEELARVIRQHDLNLLFVAFTATPSQATLDLFDKPFDSYTEAEAIQEGYIVDVAASIISYKTLYNLHCHFKAPPGVEEKTYPKGVVAKALMNVAFQDYELIQYKAEVMLRIFEEKVMPLISGRAKAMIVTSSRIAGLRYFDIIKEKIKERGAKYKVLYAFSDFTHPETNAEIHEHAINGLQPGELIEERFEGDDYRIMIVASKFQTGFDQLLLAGMFLDKPVVDRNAVQTVSRLNRCCEGKKGVIVVDFTNNAEAILKAFQKYRKGTPFVPDEPDEKLCPKYYKEILDAGVFTQKNADEFIQLVMEGKDADVQYFVGGLRKRFQDNIPDNEERKAFVYLLARYVKAFHFLTSFFTFASELKDFAIFAEYVGPQLIKIGSLSDLMKQIRQTEVIKAGVKFQGIRTIPVPTKPRTGHGKKGAGPAIKKVSIQDMIDEIIIKFAITDEEALYIKQVTEGKIADGVIGDTVRKHREDPNFLEGTYRGRVNGEIQDTYDELGRYNELANQDYTRDGGIFDILAVTVIQTHLSLAA